MINSKNPLEMWRKKNKLTRAEMGAMVGLTRQGLEKILSDASDILASTANRIKKLTGLKPEKYISFKN